MSKTENSAKNSLELNSERGCALDDTGKKAVSKELWFNYFTEALYEKGHIEAELKAKMMNAIEAKFGNGLF